MTRNEEIVWAAALFEGEGSLSFNHNNTRWGFWRLQLKMTDEDTVRTFGEFVGVGHLLYVTRQSPCQDGTARKQAWVWNVNKQADVLALAHMLYPYLGSRRQAKVREFTEDMFQ